MGGITVQLASCLFFLVSVALPMLNKHLFFLFGQIQISQTGGQLYGDTSPMVSVLLINSNGHNKIIVVNGICHGAL